MSKFVAGLTTTAGSTTLPLAALVGGTGARIRIVEIGVFNTTTTAVNLVLCRLSTAGTPGTAATSRLTDSADAATAVGALRNTYTSTAPTTTELGIGFPLGAAVGAGLVLTFPDDVLTIPATANAGIGFLLESGTIQAVRLYVRWNE
jgi:hypothetical protein